MMERIGDYEVPRYALSHGRCIRKIDLRSFFGTGRHASACPQFLEAIFVASHSSAWVMIPSRARTFNPATHADSLLIPNCFRSSVASSMPAALGPTSLRDTHKIWASRSKAQSSSALRSALGRVCQRRRRLRNGHNAAGSTLRNSKPSRGLFELLDFISFFVICSSFTFFVYGFDLRSGAIGKNVVC